MHQSCAECECMLLSTMANFLCMSAGLLLNNLSVYHGCEIVFDSSEVPDQAVSVATDVPDVQVSTAAADDCSCTYSHHIVQLLISSMLYLVNRIYSM